MTESRRWAVFGTERRRAGVVCLGVFLIGWLAWSLASFAYAVPTKLYVIPTGSMAPTIRPGDRVGVATARSRPKRGEIWVLRMPPASRLAPNQAIKRVIGLPGETVEVTGGRVLVDGRVLDEPYLAAPTSYSLPPLVLGPDEYFVLGDSRNSSFDSHEWGPLPADHLVGPVTVRYWPLGRLGGF
jgi:signal peptidase I